MLLYFYETPAKIGMTFLSYMGLHSAATNSVDDKLLYGLLLLCLPSVRAHKSRSEGGRIFIFGGYVPAHLTDKGQTPCLFKVRLVCHCR